MCSWATTVCCKKTVVLEDPRVGSPHDKGPYMYHGIKRQTVICRVAEGTQSGNLVRHGAKHMSDWCRLLKALLKSRFTKTWPRGNIYKKRREVNGCFRSTRNALTKMPREKYKNNSDLHRRCWHTSKIGDAGRNQQRWGRSYRWDSTRRIPPFFLKANSLPPNKKSGSRWTSSRQQRINKSR